MARTRNDNEYSNKRKEIINAAIGMIMKVGYKKFSLNQLLKTLEMSKGAFFHYFKSKEELLDSVITYASQGIIEKIRLIGKDQDLTPTEKIRSLYNSSSMQTFNYGDEGKVFAQKVYSKDNQIFIDLLADAAVNECSAFFEKVIKEGNATGEFRVKQVKGTVTQMMNLTLATNKEISEYILSERTAEDIVKVTEIVEVFEGIIEYLLGCNGLGELYIRIV